MASTQRALHRGNGAAPETRFSIDRHVGNGDGSSLADDVRAGLTAAQKTLPSKYFYDEQGSRLFDAICELPEYYLTRAEQALLDRHARELLAAGRPSDLIELGSGAARKTRALLDAAEAENVVLRYHPFDVCEEMLRESGDELVRRYPWIEVRAIVGDYDHHLPEIPDGRRRLVAFLGSTLGNYGPSEAARFLASVAAVLRPGEMFLLGVDLVKPVARLEAAYNDAQGVTAEFNRNVLQVINRELDADFRPERFEHVAFFNRPESRIEMHLRSREEQSVRIARLDLEVSFRSGETIHTEISRKFERDSLEAALEDAGFALRRWLAPPDDAFALVLAERR